VVPCLPHLHTTHPYTHTHTHARTHTHTHTHTPVPSSMYFDEDGDLAHEFYCEERVETRLGEVIWSMRKIVDHLRPQVSSAAYNWVWIQSMVYAYVDKTLKHQD